MVKPVVSFDPAPMLRHLESVYPEEGCGLVLAGPDGGVFRPMANVYNRYHAKDPVRYPRNATTAYAFDSREWMAVLEEAEKEGMEVAMIVHSHADVGAYFSAEDKEMAAPFGEPVLPDVSYLVVAVDKGRFTGAKCFVWQEGDFQESGFILNAVE